MLMSWVLLSTCRKLRAIEEGLKVRGRELQWSFVRWGCDNWAAGVIVRVGSMKADCHEVALRIAELAKHRHRRNVTSNPLHIV